MTPQQRIAGLYEDHAAAWDEARGVDPRLERRWLDQFAALIPRGGTVLDLGCGSGQPIARDLIAHGFRIVGVDTSPSLIALCRRRFPDQEWLVADMRRLDLGRRFDGAVAWHSSFHLSPGDQRALFPRFGAHLSAGAPLMFTSGDDEDVRIGEWQSEPLYHASLAPDEYRMLLESNGFELVDHRPRDPDCGEATVWLARRTG